MVQSRLGRGDELLMMATDDSVCIKKEGWRRLQGGSFLNRCRLVAFDWSACQISRAWQRWVRHGRADDQRQPAAQTLLHNTIPTYTTHACRRLPLLYTATHLTLPVAPSTTLSPFTALLYYPAITRADTSPTFLPDHRPTLQRYSSHL